MLVTSGGLEEVQEGRQLETECRILNVVKMIIEEVYRFDDSDYDENGFHKKTGELLIEIIKEWETDFHSKNSPCFTNYLFTNRMFMILLANCHELEEEEDFGVELINGEINMEESYKFYHNSKYLTVYAIGSCVAENKEEPIGLIIDEEMTDGVAILKYIPDDKGDDVPVQPNLCKVHNPGKF